MSDYLTLCQKFTMLTGITGASVPSVLNQTGMNQRIVDFIADADMNIQNLRIDWKFLDTLVVISLADTKDTYTLADLTITDMNFWDEKNFYIHPGEANYRPLHNFDYYEWLSSRERLGVKVNGEPNRVVIMPNNSLVFVDVPVDGNTVWGRYFKEPTRMTANASVSSIPTMYEMIILYRAKMYYGEYYEHWDLYKSADKDYKAELVKLEATQIPDQEGRGKMANDSEDLATVPV